MNRLSINETTTFRWTFEEDVARYRAAGIAAMGVWRQKLSDFGEEKGIELLAESGLAVSNLGWAGGFTGSEGRTFRESIDDALEAIQLASQMQAGCVVVYSGARHGHTHNHARRLTRDALRELGDAAEAAGTQLAVELMHPNCAGESTFLTSLNETVELLDAVERPAVKLALDTYHLSDEEDLLERLPDLIPKLAIVHLGDRRRPPRKEQNRARLGDGELPLKDIISTLDSHGYRGFYDVVLLGEDVEGCDYADLLEHSKHAYAELVGQLA